MHQTHYGYNAHSDKLLMSKNKSITILRVDVLHACVNTNGWRGFNCNKTVKREQKRLSALYLALKTVRVRERNPRRGKDGDNALIYRSPQQMELHVSDHWMGRSFSANKAYSLRDILQPSFSNESPLFHIPPPPRLPKTGQAHYPKHDKEHVCLCLPCETHNLRNKNLQETFFLHF